MLDFGLMKVEGFGSIKNEEFNWNQRGLNIIHAPNGTGKSKFVNALVWALYGRTLSGSVETWEHLRGDDYSGTKVSIFIKKDQIPFQIIRCKNYKRKVRGVTGKNRLIIVEDGTEIDIDDKRELQTELEGILGYSLDLFKNSIIFGQKLKRLVSETGPNKKKLLDEAFEVGYIAKANKIASERLKIANEGLIKAEHSLELIQNNHQANKMLLENAIEVVNSFEADKKKDIAAEKEKINKSRVELSGKRVEIKVLNKLKPLIEEYRERVEELEKEVKSYRDIEIELTQKIYERSTWLTTIGGLKGKIKVETDTLKVLPTVCFNCKKPFTDKEQLDEKERLTNKLEEYQKEYLSNKTKLGIVEEAMSKLNLAVSSMDTIKTSIDTYKSKLNGLEQQMMGLSIINMTMENIRDNMKSYKSNIEKISQKASQNNIEKFTRTLSDLVIDMKAKNKEVRILNKSVKDLTWLVKDPLSNAGLKAFIFDQMLSSINNRLEYYSKFSGSSIGFMIDMESAKKDLITWIAKGDDFVTYEELSGGQQQKVDIVIVFAIHDVISKNNNCSLMILDELFESLDISNIEMLTELIQEIALTKSLYIITHRSEFVPTNTNLINLVNIDGFTTIDN